MTARDLPWEQNGLPPIVDIMRIASAKSRSARGASHQPALMSSAWLLVTRVCLAYLVDELSPCVLQPLMIELMVVLFMFFWMVSMVLLLRWVDAILRNRCWIEGQNYLISPQESEMAAGCHYMGLLFIYFTICHTCLPCLLSRWVYFLCSMAPLPLWLG